MLDKVSGKISLIMCIGLAAVTPSIVGAAEIALTFETQGVTIAGDYQGFRDNAYVVKTPDGIIHIPANLAVCDGADCLDILVGPTADR